MRVKACFVRNVWILISFLCLLYLLLGNFKRPSSDELKVAQPPLDLCSEGLNGSEFEYDPIVNNQNGWNSMRPKKPCRLHEYQLGDVVNCLDSHFRQPRKLITRFVFVGDSRIRQQFYNFLKFIPNYDEEVEIHRDLVELDQTVDLHVDKTVTSRVLNLEVIYLWRPVLNDEFISSFRQWTNDNNPPRFILTGVASHHVKLKHLTNHIDFQQKFLQFQPLLRQISNQSAIVWLNQFPLVDRPSIGNDAPHRDIITFQMERYNNLTRILLRDTGVMLMESGIPSVAEYVRACRLFYHRDHQYDLQYRNSFFKCKDDIHPGFVVLSHVTQLLLNQMCNKPLFFH